MSRFVKVVCTAALSVLLLTPPSHLSAQTPTVHDPYVAPSDQALLVFSRARRRQASETTIRVVNPAGRCLAELDNGLQMTATLWPGTHMLMVVMGEAPPTVQLVEAKVKAGLTYVVRLETRVNVKSPVRITVLRRSDEPLEAFPSSIREAIPATPDLRKCTEWVSWKSEKITPRARRAKRDWDQADEAFRELRTVHRNDGWTAAEVKTP